MADRDAPPAHQPQCPASGGDGALPRELRGWMLLLAATGAVEQRLHTLVKDRLDVSHDEFLILCLLADQPDGLRMTRIAELLGRPKTRLTYQIACLQHAGLVTRASACGDKRGITVTLTPKSHTLLHETAHPLAQTVRDALTEVMGPAEVNAVCALLPALAGGEERGEPEGTRDGTGGASGGPEEPQGSAENPGASAGATKGTARETVAAPAGTEAAANEAAGVANRA